MSFQMPPIMITPDLLPILLHLQIKYNIPQVPVIPLGSSCPVPQLSCIPCVPCVPQSPASRTLSPATSHNSAGSSNSSSSTPSPCEERKSPRGCRCDICGKTFSRHWLLQGHIRTHTGEKPFKCELCGKAFADKSNLRAHTQTHSGEKPHRCVRCGKRFALRSYLSKHEESACIRQSHHTQIPFPFNI